MPTYQALLPTAIANRPELDEARTQLGMYRELVKIARAVDKPRLDFTGACGKRSLGLRTLSSDGTAWNAGTLATIPIFDGLRTKGRVLQADTDSTRFAFDERKLYDAISVEVANDAAREASEIVTELRRCPFAFARVVATGDSYAAS